MANTNTNPDYVPVPEDGDKVQYIQTPLFVNDGLGFDVVGESEDGTHLLCQYWIPKDQLKVVIKGQTDL